MVEFLVFYSPNDFFAVTWLCEEVCVRADVLSGYKQFSWPGKKSPQFLVYQHLHSPRHSLGTRLGRK